MAKKKMNYTPYILGVAAAAGMAYIFKDDIKAFFKKDDTNTKDDQQNENPPITDGKDGGGGGGGGGAVIGSSNVTSGFHKLGTSKNQLNVSQYFKFGDKGQEVNKMQQILNRIASITKKAPQITEDGSYGIGTETRLKQLFTDIDKINLYKMYAALFAIYQAKKFEGKTQFKSDWIIGYLDILSKPSQYAEYRKYYFDSNNPI
jgi:hypothetical protein